MHVKKFSASRHNGWHIYRNQRWHWKPWFPGEVFTIHFRTKITLKKIKSRICFQVLDYPMWNLPKRGGIPAFNKIPQDKAAESPDSGAMLPAPRSESSLRVLENKAPEVRRGLCQWKLWDGWMDCMFFFVYLPQGQKDAVFFFKHFVFKVGDGWMVFWIQEYEQFGKILACCMGFFSPTWTLQGVPNGWERVPFKTPPIGGWLVRIFSVIQLFRGCVEDISRGFPYVWRRGSSQESFNCQNSNSWLIQVRDIPQRSHVLKHDFCCRFTKRPGSSWL